ncbi:MAG: DNA alkylation repair protein [Fimbriimonadaceae bacterium]
MSMNTSLIVAQVRRELKASATPVRAAYEKRYLKSELVFLGAPAAAHHACAKRLVRENKGIARPQLLALVDAMWATGVHEIRSVAVLVLIELSGLLRRSDLPLLRKWVIKSDGWALVDTIACHLLPRMVAADPDVLSVMDRWSVDKNFWVRRAAMLSLLLPLRRGDLTEWPRFVRYSRPQLTEKEFFIRKAIGWILREVTKKNPDVVFEFLSNNLETASGLTVREGAKYLPTKQRKTLGLT